MTFRMSVSPTVSVPVTGSIPDENGRAAAFSFSLICRRLPASELKDSVQATEATIPEFMVSVVQGWSGLQDEAGQPLAYSREALDKLFEIVGMAGVAFGCYLQACSVKGKEKN